MKQQAGMEHVEFTDQQVRAVTVWKVEADYFTAKSARNPSRICTETPRRWCYHPRQRG